MREELSRAWVVNAEELGMAEDGGLHLGDGELQRGIAGAIELPEQGGTQAGHDFPVSAEGASRSRSGMPPRRWHVDVLQIFRIGAVDVAREVEVVVVLRVGDFGDGDHTRA